MIFMGREFGGDFEDWDVWWMGWGEQRWREERMRGLKGDGLVI